MSRQTKKSFRIVDSNKASSRIGGRKRGNGKGAHLAKDDFKRGSSELGTRDTVTEEQFPLEVVTNSDGNNLKNFVKNSEAATPNHRGRKKSVIKQVKFDEKSIEETSPALMRHKLEDASADSIGQKIESVVKKLKTHRSTRSSIAESHPPGELLEADLSTESIKEYIEDRNVITRNRKNRAKKRISNNKSTRLDSRESRSKNFVAVASKNNLLKTENITLDNGGNSKSGKKKRRKNLPPLADTNCLPNPAVSKYASLKEVEQEQFSINEVFLKDQENSLNHMSAIHNQNSENTNILDVLSNESMSYSFEMPLNSDAFMSYEHVKKNIAKTGEIADPFCLNKTLPNFTEPNALNLSSDQQLLDKLNSENKTMDATSQYILEQPGESFPKTTIDNQDKLNEFDENLCQFMINENKENIIEECTNFNMRSTLKPFPPVKDLRLADFGNYVTKNSCIFSKPTKLLDDELKQTLNESFVPYWPNLEGDETSRMLNSDNVATEKQQQQRENVTTQTNTNTFLSCGDEFEGGIKPKEMVAQDHLVERETAPIMDTAAHSINGINDIGESQIEDKKVDCLSPFYPGINEVPVENGLVKQEKIDECDACYPDNLSTNPVDAEMPFSLMNSSTANIFSGDIIPNQLHGNPRNEYFEEMSASCLNFSSTLTNAAFAEKNRSLVEPQDGNEVFYICEECDFETKVENEFSFHYSLGHMAKQPEDNGQNAICIQISNRATQTNSAMPSDQTSDQINTDQGSAVYPRTFQHKIKTRERKSKRLLVYDDSSGEGIVMYQCGVCQFRAEYGKRLEEHYAEAHGLRLELFECSHPHCGFVTFLRESLLHHYRAQHVEVGVLLRPTE